MIVYKITNKLNGKIYIGQTTSSLSFRWRGHWKERRGNRPISSAIKKYGRENFSIEPLLTCSSINELNAAEIHYIALYDSVAPRGYNLLHGGRNSKHTSETKAKLSKACMGRPSAFKGRQHSAESKELLIQSHVGKTVSEATKARISDAMSGDKNPFYGKTHSLETIEKIRAARARSKGIKRGPYKKRGLQVG